jgi:hypothetical protein
MTGLISVLSIFVISIWALVSLICTIAVVLEHYEHDTPKKKECVDGLKKYAIIGFNIWIPFTAALLLILAIKGAIIYFGG